MKNIAFREGETHEIEQLIKQEMDKAIKHFEKELLAIRTGRASVKLLDHIMVDCYGSMMALKELATLSAPESRLLTIQPWDTSLIGAIEKALMTSDIGVTPVNDGALIRLQLPQMSTARRDEMVKILGKKAEECKVAVRNVRKDFHNEIRDAEKKKILSQDFARKLVDLLQKHTDLFIEKTEELENKKTQELTQI